MLGVTFVSAAGLLVFSNIKPDLRFEIDLRLTWNWNAATQMFWGSRLLKLLKTYLLESLFVCFYSTFSCCKKQFQHHQMFCENIFSCLHMIMILYPLYIVHIITTALTPSSTSAQKACSPPLSLCFPVSWRSSRSEPMSGTHPSGEPLPN